jgi:hypothetical protein
MIKNQHDALVGHARIVVTLVNLPDCEASEQPPIKLERAFCRHVELDMKARGAPPA